MLRHRHRHRPPPGILDLYNQKRYCAAINIWIRGPFLVVAAFIMYQATIYGKNSMPWPVSKAAQPHGHTAAPTPIGARPRGLASARRAPQCPLPSVCC